MADLSKIEEGKMMLSITEIDPESHLQCCVREVGGKAQIRGVEFTENSI
jgi:hypothetical protein